MRVNLYLVLIFLITFLTKVDSQRGRGRRNRQIMTASWQTKLLDGNVVDEYGDAKNLYDQNRVYTGKVINITSNQMAPNSIYSNSIIKYYFEAADQGHLHGMLIVVVNMTMSSGQEREICMVRNTRIDYDRALYEMYLRGGSPYDIPAEEGGHFTVTIPNPRVPRRISRLCTVTRRRRGSGGGRIRLLLTPSELQPKAEDIRISGLFAEDNHQGYRWMYNPIKHDTSASITIDRAAVEPLVKQIDTRRAG